MSITPLSYRLPRAGVDRIDGHAAALAVVAMAIHRPFRHETIVVTLDHQRRGIAIVVVSHTTGRDHVIDVVDRVVEPYPGDRRIGGLIVASVRPGPDGARVSGSDVDRWLELSDNADAAGFELVEWYVIGSTVTCPRDLLGERPRW